MFAAAVAHELQRLDVGCREVQALEGGGAGLDAGCYRVRGQVCGGGGSVAVCCCLVACVNGRAAEGVFAFVVLARNGEGGEGEREGARRGEHMGALRGGEEVGEVDYERGAREEVGFVRRVDAFVVN